MNDPKDYHITPWPIDYSQLELRILAQAMRERGHQWVPYVPSSPRVTSLITEMALRGLQEPQERPRDIHEAIAMRMFGRPRSGLTEAERQLHRAASFSLLYGMDSHKARRHFAMTEGYRRAYGPERST